MKKISIDYVVVQLQIKVIAIVNVKLILAGTKELVKLTISLSDLGETMDFLLNPIMELMD